VKVFSHVIIVVQSISVTAESVFHLLLKIRPEAIKFKVFVIEVLGHYLLIISFLIYLYGKILLFFIKLKKLNELILFKVTLLIRL
jgi:hypothetical protein